MRRIVTAFILTLYLLTGCTALKSSALQSVLLSRPASIQSLATTAPASDALTEKPSQVPDAAYDVASPIPTNNGSPAPDASNTPATSPSNAPIMPSDGQDLPPVPPPPVEYPALLDQIFSECQGFSGSVLIARGGSVIFSKSYGMANPDYGITNTTETKFLVGSVTKQFTAMAVMQLYEKGLLNISDKLSKYIPDFSRGGDITLWNLLTHTSGILDYLNDDPPIIASIPFEEVGQRHLISLIKTQPLKFEPGSKYSYSNSNYLILGYIVEKVSGLSYGDYLIQNIFEPLGMQNTGLLDFRYPPENMAKGHWRTGVPILYYTPEGDIIAETANSVKGAYGAGRLYSTVGDLYIWDQALQAETLLSKPYMDMMFYSHVPVPNAVPKSAYGFGWVVEDDRQAGTVIRHTGTLSGFRAYNGMFADRGVTVIVLMNVKEFSGREDLIPALKEILGISRLRNQSQENPPTV